MIKKLLIPVFIFLCSYCSGETIKTDVLVIGGGACGVAAAIQSARSKVKTLLVEPGPWLGGSMTMGGMCVLDANRDLPSGVWGEFRKKITDYYRPRLGYDTSHNSILRFEPYTAAELLKKWTDTVKNLTVKLKTPWTSIKKDGTGWQVIIRVNGEDVKIDAKVVIDGTETGEVAAKAGVKFVEEQAAKEYAGFALTVLLKDFGRTADKTIPKPEKYDRASYACLTDKELRQLLQDGGIPNDKYMIRWRKICQDRSDTSEYNANKLTRLYTLGLVYYIQTELGHKNLGIDDQFGTSDNLPLIIPHLTGYHPTQGMVRMVRDDITKPYERESKLYRTSIAVADVPDGRPNTVGKFTPFSIPLGIIVPKDIDNLLVTEKAISVTNELNSRIMDPSVQMTLGQGVGATAAYLAFFKTTTKHLNVRIIQGEVLDYKGYLLPITDIPQKDPHWRAVQQVCATGMLKRNGYLFKPGDIVTTEEVKPVFDEDYARAFIWFNKEKPGEKLTLGNLLGFISDYTLTDPKTLELMIGKAWKPVFKLPGELDMARPATRLEFAVLVNRYMNPFAKTVDLSGRVVN